MKTLITKLKNLKATWTWHGIRFGGVSYYFDTEQGPPEVRIRWDVEKTALWAAVIYLLFK